MTYVNSVIYFLLTYSHQIKISNMVTSGVSLKSLTEGIKIWHPGRKSNTRETMQTITSKVMVCLTSNKPLFRRLLDSLLAKTGTVPNKILLRLPHKSAWCLALSETPVTSIFTCLQVEQHLPSHCGRTTWWCVESVQEAYHLISWKKKINIYIAQSPCEYDQMCVTNKYDTN